jgi:hypothetical protein
MIHEEYTITHRVIGEKTTVEHLISVVPYEDLFNIIDRIRPVANDEIVIKVIDKTLNANKEAENRTNAVYQAFSQNLEQRMNEPIDHDDLPF